MHKTMDLEALAKWIDAQTYAHIGTRYHALFDPAHVHYAKLLSVTYPAFASIIERHPEWMDRLNRDDLNHALDKAQYLNRVDNFIQEQEFLNRFRTFSNYEKLRIALREILPAQFGNADITQTSFEISQLAEACVEIAFEEARQYCEQRYGVATRDDGHPSRFCILGMGKLGGEELNAGSDIDLIYVYDSDEGYVKSPVEESSDITLHQFWTRVAKRLTANLEELTPEGMVWRVDLRLRPEGRSGPLVNSLIALEQYYESFGRLWERSAYLRARPVAGDIALGQEALQMLQPFVWQRRVDPTIPSALMSLVKQARSETPMSIEHDLKIGEGGIREAEFFVQSLQLVWGGRALRLRAKNTIDSLRRLRMAGYVSHREEREIAEAYLFLRRVEHIIQFRSGQQTHCLPETIEERLRVARSLGYADESSFMYDLQKHRDHVQKRVQVLLGAVPSSESRHGSLIGICHVLEQGTLDEMRNELSRLFRVDPDAYGQLHDSDTSLEIARHLFELKKRPDMPFGIRSMRDYPELVELIVQAVLDAADSEQAARYLRLFFARVYRPEIYVRWFAENKQFTSRFIDALGASAFIGDEIAAHPDLAECILFEKDTYSESEVVRTMRDALHHVENDADLVHVLRREKTRMTMNIALADLSGGLDTREIGARLSSLAEVSLQCGLEFVFDKLGRDVSGVSIIAMGKLGGREIGYGSDLDILFIYDPTLFDMDHPDVWVTRKIRKLMSMMTVSDPSGRGYELDTRLRPSGNKGLLITSFEAFGRYHAERSAIWERQALLRSRFVAGDVELGQRFTKLRTSIAYESGISSLELAREIHRLRLRMEHELSKERSGRYDLKWGKGGIIDIEFAVQKLQMQWGHDSRVRTTETLQALDVLEECQYLRSDLASALRDGYRFLRRLEQRIRILHADDSHLLERDAPGFAALARRMGIRGRPNVEVSTELLTQYQRTTERVRHAYEEIISK